MVLLSSPPRSFRARLRAPLIAGLTLAMAACGGSPPPQANDATDATLEPSSEYSVGSHVLVSRGGQWLPATIVQATADQRFVIQYDGYGPQWNEAVGQDRLKPAAQAVADYKVGERVLVTAQNLWRVADVIQQLTPTSYRVHYDGYGPEVAENVGPDRMKKTFAGASAHAPGEAVLVDVNGQTLPAKVMAASAADRWIVRFDGYGAQYDQEVGAERVHAAPPAPPPVAAAPPTPAPPAPPPPDASANAKGKKDKSAPPAAAPAAPANAPLAVGDEVFVSNRGAWYPAKIVAPGAAAGSFKVKYEAGGDEEASADRVARANPNLKGAKYQPNQLVFIEWHGMFVPGKVLKDNGPGVYKVRYDGQGPEADDLVASKRLHPR